MTSRVIRPDPAPVPEAEIKAAKHRCRYGRTTDADRVLLATDEPFEPYNVPSVRNGPVEHARCPLHPRNTYTYRWFWTAPEYVEEEIQHYGRPDSEPVPTDADQLAQTGEVEQIAGCKKCAKLRLFDTL